MKVSLGLIISHGFPVPAPFVIGYSQMMQCLLTGAGNQVIPDKARRIDRARALFVQDFPIDWARNRCCQIFLDEDDGDYLLFLDTDMVHPPDLPHRLVACGVDMVTAHYVLRKPPFWTIAMRKVGDGATEYMSVDKLQDPVQGLMPIDAGGAGALLLSRKLLMDMRQALGDDWFRYQDSPEGKRSRSEDMWCYEQARALGYQPYLAADVKCQHIMQMAVDWRNQEPYREAFARELAAAEVAAAGKGVL